jgi:hypothetical protein
MEGLEQVGDFDIVYDLVEYIIYSINDLEIYFVINKTIMDKKIREICNILIDKVQSKFVAMKIMEYADFDKVKFKGYTMIGNKKIKHPIITKRNRKHFKLKDLIKWKLQWKSEFRSLYELYFTNLESYYYLSQVKVNAHYDYLIRIR